MTDTAWKPTPGRDECTRLKTAEYFILGLDGGYHATFGDKSQAEFIAAANPAAILSLIEENKRMQEALSALYAAFLSRHGSFPLDRVTPEQRQWNDAMSKANDLRRLS